MDEEEWPQNQFEMSKDAVTEQKKSGRSNVKSAEENHEENQLLFAVAARTKESTIGVPAENKLMKAGREFLVFGSFSFFKLASTYKTCSIGLPFLAQLSKIERKKNSRRIDT